MKRVVPLKNYIILTVVFLATIILVLFLADKYDQRIKNKTGNTIMSDFLPQVTNEEFDNYILENPNVIVYLASISDEKLNIFENNFKEFITHNELTNSVVQINSDELDKNIFTEYLPNNMNLNIIPNILVFKNGKIASVLYNSEKNIDIADVKQFLKDNGIIND